LLELFSYPSKSLARSAYLDHLIVCTQVIARDLGYTSARETI